MAVEISNLTPELRVELPGIAEPILNAAIYRVLRRFFWESEAWKYTYDNGKDWAASTLLVPLPVAGTDTPAKTVVKRVDTIKYSADGANWGGEVPFKTRDELDRIDPDWRTTSGSTPKYWTHDNDAQAAITPLATTTVATGLLIRAVIAPVFTVPSDTLPDFIYYEFEETIRAGILADRMKQPGRDWTNTKMAAFYARQFRDGITDAKSRAEADYGQPDGVMSYGGL